MGFINRNQVISLAFLIIAESFGSASKVTAISAYHSPTTLFEPNGPSKSFHSQHQISASSIKDSFAERQKASGNVIFNDNLAFSPSTTSAENEGSKRKKSLSDEQNSEYSHHIVAGGYLKNHRLEEGHISTSTGDAASASAAAVVAPNFYNNINDQVNDNSQRNNNVHRAVGVEAGNIIEGASGHGTHGRAFSPYNQGTHHGWASNPGSCLFSCSSGNIGHGAVSCCQQNYAQCCPNPHQETLNFKNLHHGRGLIGGNFGKSGYSWGPAPYNPPPIIRKPHCQPQPYPFHPGIVSPTPIVHGADHVGGGIGWGAGGNGAAGYYFHRRSDKNGDYLVDERSHSPQKRRLTRSIHKGGEFVQPCPVYSSPQNYGWPSRPLSVGLGSLIGWSRPVNHIQTGFAGGGGFHGGSHLQQHVPGGGGYGLGWGSGVGRGFCKWDYECPGFQKCCKGTCQLTPYK